MLERDDEKEVSGIGLDENEMDLAGDRIDRLYDGMDLKCIY
jgi:hypothetical protein